MIRVERETYIFYYLFYKFPNHHQDFKKPDMIFMNIMNLSNILNL